MNMKVIIGMLLLVSLTLSGCLTVDVGQTIEKDGTSHITIEYDISGIPEGLEDVDLEETNQEEMERYCESFYANTTLDNPECVINEKGVTLSGSLQLGDKLVKNGNKYTFDMVDIFQILDESMPSDEGVTTEEQFKEYKAMAPLMNIEATYTLRMPAEITHADIGEVNGSTVTVDMFELVGQEHAYVECKVKAIPGMAFGVAVTMLFLVIFMLKRK